MDKLFKSNWFIKILSFLIALMLYTMVAAGGQSSSPFGFAPSSNQASNSDQPQASAQVKLNAHYNDNKYLLSGLPDTVTVLLQGPSGLLTQVRLVHNYEVYVDLTGKGPGTYTVPVEVKGFPDGLAVTTYPKKVKVTVSAKETKTFPVHIDLINTNKVTEGYKAGTPSSTPAQVKITAAKDVVDNIAFVEGLVNVAGAKDPINTTVPIHVFDKEGNELNVSVSPANVEVKVPIKENSKMVSLEVKKQGQLPDGYSLGSIKFKTDQVTLFGPKDILKDINAIQVPVKLDNISEDTTLKVEIPVPAGADKVSPGKVSAVIKVKKQATKTLENVPITVKGKSAEQQVSFIDPGDQQVNLTLTAPKKVLKGVGASDIEVSVDISSLSSGEHSVPIDIKSSKPVKINPGMTEAVIQITNNGSSGSGGQ